MRTVLIYSLLLFVGLGLSQVLPVILGDAHDGFSFGVRVLTMIGLAFIMIHVGFEFHIDKSRLGIYGKDYLVAFTAASFPWIFVSCYFVFIMLPPEVWGNFDAWKETLLAGRFAAPTSAGVLFSMLAAAGLGATWLFQKARVLAIFDDLDTVLLMIPLKMLMVGIAWQLGVSILVMVVYLWLAYIYLHRLNMPVSWNWVLLYAAVIVTFSEILYMGSKWIDPSIPIHIEVLLPAFVVGCVARSRGTKLGAKSRDIEYSLHKVLERPGERRAAMIVSASFMVLVGLSMPSIFQGPDSQHNAPTPAALHAAAPGSVVDSAELHGGREEVRYTRTITAGMPNITWGMIALHVLAITVLSNLGKMYPFLCYRKEADWRQRLAVAIGMWPRGEVGAGVLVLSLSYGIGGPIVTVAMLSLALNLALTGVFILVIKKLIRNIPEGMEKTVAGV
jgi:Kef-type K+ transport system membrane component KefB